jgi:hypothetical protein
MSAAGFAGGDVVLTFASDLRQARADFAAFKGEVERTPVKVQFAGGGSGGFQSSTGPGGYVPPPAGPAAPSAFAGGVSPAAAASTAPDWDQFFSGRRARPSGAAAVPSASPPPPSIQMASQAAAMPPAFGGGGFAQAGGQIGGTTLQGPFTLGPTPLPTIAAAQMAAATPAVQQVAALVRERKNVVGRAAAGTGELQIGQTRAVASAFGAMEFLQSRRAARQAELRGAFADTADEALSAQLAGIEAQTGGFFGNAAGLVLDEAGDEAAPWWKAGGLGFLAGVIPSPKKVREQAMAAQFGNRATTRTRDAMADTIISRIRREGAAAGPFGERLAGIEAGRLGQLRRITSEQEQISFQEGLIEKLDIPDKDAVLSQSGARRRALERQREEVETSAAAEVRRARGNLEDDIADLGDEAETFRGNLPRGQARRRAMLRRHRRTTGGDDDRLEAAELSAFDAAESYRTGERLRAAKEERGQAELSLNRQFLTADVQDIFNRGERAARDALREGTAEEASVIRQTTRIQLQAFGRNLIEGGTAEFVENPRALDFSGTGLNRQDDTAQALQRIEELLRTVVQEVAG